MTITKKDKVAAFKNFADYRARLTMAMKAAIENGKDPHRKISYGIVSTISSGYDSTCCAAIAREHGCDTVITFEAKGKFVNDSGIEPAKALGYKNIIVRDANEYLHYNILIEAEAIASGVLGNDFHYAVYDDVFEGELCFVGERGDYIWGVNKQTANNNFAFNTFVAQGSGSAERKLWLGYIYVPMTLFGASAWESIQAISKSEEMKPSSLNQVYDKPIPRRICEEAGVPRNLFGIKKQPGAGITLRYDWGKRAKSRMSPAASKSFSKYVKANWKPHFIQCIQYFWKARKIYLARLGFKLPGTPTRFEGSKIANATVIRYLFPWASEIVQEKYRSIITKNP